MEIYSVFMKSSIKAWNIIFNSLYLILNMISYGLVLCLFAALTNGASIGEQQNTSSNYPYQVSFREQIYPDPEEEYVHYCSGVILNKNWILSTASCFEDRDIANDFVNVGSENLAEGGQKYDMNFVIFQDEYEVPYDNNIALIRIVGDIEFNEKVQPVNFPNSAFSEYNTFGEITGWFTKKDLTSEQHMKAVSLPVISNEECLKKRKINEKHICVDDRTGDFCHEDIGAPLIVNNVLVGIESYVAPCAAGLPDVFTRVYSYSEWIQEVMKRFE